jgi:hypothetical protein
MWSSNQDKSRRCATCDIYWPHSAVYSQCPICETYTDSSEEPSLPAGEVADLIAAHKLEVAKRETERRLAHEKFEAICRERDELLVQELITALDLLPTAPASYDHPEARSTTNYGRAGGELPS